MQLVRNKLQGYIISMMENLTKWGVYIMCAVVNAPQYII